MIWRISPSLPGGPKAFDNFSSSMLEDILSRPFHEFGEPSTESIADRFLPRPEAVEKIRQGEIGGPGDARGNNKFAPPKQALVSPWPA